jgi:hypothetical protein
MEENGVRAEVRGGRRGGYIRSPGAPVLRAVALRFDAATTADARFCK